MGFIRHYNHLYVSQWVLFTKYGDQPVYNKSRLSKRDLLFIIYMKLFIYITTINTFYEVTISTEGITDVVLKEYMTKKGFL